MSDTKTINVTINKKACVAEPEQSILQLAIQNKIDIPHFCYHEDLPVGASCRTCLVEIVNPGENKKLKAGQIVTSCTLKACEGLVVTSLSDEVLDLRTENLELLLAGHIEMCPKCQQGYFCHTAEKMERYGITGEQYQKLKKDWKIHHMVTAAEIDPNLCIKCNKCVEICQKIGIGFLELKGKGADTYIGHDEDPKTDCVYCGQCTVHCPVGAVREQSHLAEVIAALKDENKIVIAQMAPSVRASIGEEFGVEPGVNLEKKMFTAFRKLGFDYVFDVNMGADITTLVEAEELVKRIKEDQVLPMFTSCCPGWVKFLEFYYPEMIPHLTTSRSPQIHSGGAYKTWWAEKAKLDSAKIVVVSFMPCTSKKYECHHEKLKIDGMYPVDYVLTTRETAVLLREYGLDPNKLEDGELDEFGQYSGAAAIYGASGGVMESALRTAVYMLTGKDLEKVEFKQVRGMKGIKTAKIQIDNLSLKVAVVATPANAHKVLQEIKKDPKAYDYVEFMACPGGCIGGGGQPIPSTEKIVAQRIAGLYKIDDKMKVRCAHHNKVATDFVAYAKSLGHEREHELLHTSYQAKKKYQ